MRSSHISISKEGCCDAIPRISMDWKLEPDSKWVYPLVVQDRRQRRATRPRPLLMALDLRLPVSVPVPVSSPLLDVYPFMASSHTSTVHSAPQSSPSRTIFHFHLTQYHVQPATYPRRSVTPYPNVNVKSDPYARVWYYTVKNTPKVR